MGCIPQRVFHNSNIIDFEVKSKISLLKKTSQSTLFIRKKYTHKLKLNIIYEVPSEQENSQFY